MNQALLQGDYIYIDGFGRLSVETRSWKQKPKKKVVFKPCYELLWLLNEEFQGPPLVYPPFNTPPQDRKKLKK